MNRLLALMGLVLAAAGVLLGLRALGEPAAAADPLEGPFSLALGKGTAGNPYAALARARLSVRVKQAAPPQAPPPAPPAPPELIKLVRVAATFLGEDSQVLLQVLPSTEVSWWAEVNIQRISFKHIVGPMRQEWWAWGSFREVLSVMQLQFQMTVLLL